MMTTNEKIAALRQQMELFDLDAYVIPSTDPHMGEYVPDHWAERTWISGFTGSAGTVVVTKDFAGLWTDSRYFLQAEEQLSGSEMKLVKLTIPHTPQHIDWLTKKLKPGSQVGVNGQMIPLSLSRQMKQELASGGIAWNSQVDLVSRVWTDRPELPGDPVADHSVTYAGKSRDEKIREIRFRLQEIQATHHLICTLDEIAWVMNLRGRDIPFNPLFVSYLLIGPKDATLYIHPQKINDPLQADMIGSGIRLKEYATIFNDLSELPPESILAIDPGKTNQALANAIPNHIKIVETIGFATLLKAIKNPTEIEGLRRAMWKDGIAWVQFLHWLDTQVGKIDITELTAANQLASFRQEKEGYAGPSFHPISSYGPNGAVVHYAVSEQSARKLKPEGIYLCDTGGHYQDGTTDTTRTIALGEPTTQQKTDFTLALKGTLAVSMLRFPEGTKGYQMDILARKALWDHGLNYGHGTGHGVGFYLNVHEGPQTIGTGATGHLQIAMEPGMVTTVEPGIYREGCYGMRTENMTLCIPDQTTDFGRFLTFETLTLVPLDKNLLAMDLLTKEETEWINAYHEAIRTKLLPHLDEETKTWLIEKTSTL